MNQGVISLGSNIEPEANIAMAVEMIAAGHRIVAQSKLVRTRPIGRTDQPDFLNGAVRIETAMDREELERWLKSAEEQLGRAPGGDKWGPRTIDLDLAVWNGRVVHDDVRQRDFLRTAVLEIWPDLTI
ncbi:MAG: 2-amino-4-hydroxy-6-hydroxymethyldihydropteridine diphosphokinase [Phycisphaerae bacterium]